MNNIIILRESAIQQLVRSRARRIGCSVPEADIAVHQAVKVYKQDNWSAFRAIQYGTAFAQALADIDDPQTAA